mgnify:CR=1 FL=1
MPSKSIACRRRMARACCMPRSTSADPDVMLSDEFPEHGGNRGPDIVGSTTVSIHLWVPNADKAFAQCGWGGRHHHHAARGHVLGRPLWQAARSVRPRMEYRPSRPRCVARRRSLRRLRRHSYRSHV